MSLASGTQLGPYEILAPIGAGGMGEVYRARDTRLNRDIAVKILPESVANDPARMQRFEREARVLASLNHPNIAAIHGIEQGALVLELVEGPTLAERIAQGAITIEEALPIARQIAEALEYAHEKGIVHRDLKPANIKITPDGRVKVLDFGLAKALAGDTPSGDPQSSPTLTMQATEVGVILGTAAYMSPEQARGHSADRRADIWAFGVVLFEMLTGHGLFAGPTISDTLAAVLKTEPDIAKLPAELRPIVERCLRKDPRRRWQAIGDVRVALEEFGVETPPPIKLRSTSWPLWTVAAALAVALAALAAIHFRETEVPPPTVRFRIPPPEGAVYGSDLALSPDGRQLAFNAYPRGGYPQLWVRALDSLDAHPLRGTEYGRYPFWSPDGRFLAFSTGGILRKIDASGGPVETLCSMPNTIMGGDWSRDGLIYFSTQGGGVFRVPQAGGDPVGVAKSDPTRFETWKNYPQILPDGRHFLYITVTGVVNSGLYISSLDGKENKRLLATNTSFRYAPPFGTREFGHVLFLRENTLTAQPLDPRSFDLRGDPFPVAEEVGYTLNSAHFTISANGALAYRSGGGEDETQLTWFDRAGKPLGTLGAQAPYNNLALSRDAARAAVVENDRPTGNRDIWLFDLARGIPTRLTFHQAVDWDPVWSPDGSRIAFSSNREGTFNLYLKDSSGARPEERLQKSGVSERPCDWSPDGRWLMYTRALSLNSVALWVLSNPAGDPTSRKATPYLDTPFSTTQCQFSPDSHWVAYSSNESMGGRDVYIQSFPVPATRFRVSSNGGGQPRWRGDRKELFYIAADGRLMAVDLKASPTFHAGIPHALFDPQISGGSSPVFNFRYDVTRDGHGFLVNRASQTPASASEPITVVLNWASGLKKK